MKTIKECIRTNNNLSDFNKKLNDLIQNLKRDINGYQKGTVHIVNEYKPYFEKFVNSYNSYYKDEKRKCFLTQSKPYSLYNYLGFVGKWFTYTDESYEKAMKYEVALLIYSYGYLDECQIKLAFIQMLYKIFNPEMEEWDGTKVFSFQINTIENIYNKIMNTELINLTKDFKENIDQNDFYKKLKKPSFDPSKYIKNKPTEPADLINDIYVEGMTRRQWIKAIVIKWEFKFTEKSAENYLKKFNLWDNLPKTQSSKTESNNELELYKNRCELLQNDLNIANQEIEKLKNEIELLKTKTVHTSFEQSDSDVIIPTLTTKNLKL